MYIFCILYGLMKFWVVIIIWQFIQIRLLAISQYLNMDVNFSEVYETWFKKKRNVIDSLNIVILEKLKKNAKHSVQIINFKIKKG